MLRFHQVTLDCQDLDPTVTSWAAALGQPVTFSSGGWAATAPEPGQPLLFQQVPEAKAAKAPVHLDLETSDLEAEITRLEGLGGRVVARRTGDGIVWATMQDPAGNEFCVAQATAGTQHGAQGTGS